MNLKEAKSIINESFIGWLRWALDLQSWEVNIIWRDLPRGVLGKCEADSRYKRADISVDARKHDSEEEIQDTVRHEMLHVVGAHFETYRRALCPIVGEKQWKILEEIWRDANEGLVKQLESIFYLQLKVDLVERARHVHEDDERRRDPGDPPGSGSTQESQPTSCGDEVPAVHP